jgi:NAD-dependent dihydropyrimidine dehydrogenase PreA subunit
MCEELIALVEHMFTTEEAEVVRHLKPWRPKSAASLASATGRPLGEVKEILQRLVHEKHVIFSFGKEEHERFFILPIVPGTFESVLVRKSLDSVTPWHKRFAELYEALYSTGFASEYYYKPVGAIRYLPVGEAVQAQPAALPSDRLEEIMERYSDFAVGVCQCRLSKQLVGEGCGRMLETCTVMGDFAPGLISEGRMKRASMKDVLEIKAAAEKEGLVTWMMNDESAKLFKSSCSCCGCCCGALRLISEFSSPGMIAPPHFMPRVDAAFCSNCGKCAKACPMGSMVMEEAGEVKRLVHKPERCIGCGLCSVACPKGAISMREVPGYREPPPHFPSYLARYGHNYVINGIKAWLSRQRGQTARGT